MAKDKSEAAAADAPAAVLESTYDASLVEAVDRLTSQLAAIYSVLAALNETLHRVYPPESLCCELPEAKPVEQTPEEKAADDRQYAEALVANQLGVSLEHAAAHVVKLGAEKAARLVAFGRGGLLAEARALLGL